MKTNFRDDIQGLRAIAVALVCLFHFEVDGFSAGYVGVDIFFVISGFLITQNIVKQIRAETFSFRKFYISRFWRLFPALFLTISVTTFLGYFIVSFNNYEGLALSSITGLLSISNIQFWLESGYFDSDAVKKPLLHLWSLSVEEQFYLFWPGALVGLGILLSACKDKIRFRCNSLLIALVILFLFTAVSEYVLRISQDAAFFLFPFRIYEFLIGAFVFLVSEKHSKTKSVKDISAFAGLFLIVISLFVLSENTWYPGVRALLPCVGAALIIYSDQHTAVGRGLSTRVMVGLGGISYSVYLVHWPVFVYLKLDTLESYRYVLLIGITLILGFLQYWLVEDRFRRIGSLRLRFRAQCIAVLLSLFTLAVFSTLYIPALRYAQLNQEIRPLALSIGSGKSGRQKMIGCMSDSSCDSFATSPNILVLGDSFSKGYGAALKSRFPGANIVIDAEDGCKFLLGLQDKSWKSSKAQRCNRYITSASQTVISRQYDLVVLGHSWSENQLAYVERTLAFLGDFQNEILLIGQKIVLKTDPGDTVSKSDSLKQFKTFSNQDAKFEKYRQINEELRKMSQSNSIFFYDPGVVQLTETLLTNVVSENAVFLYDNGHMTQEAIILLGENLGEVLLKEQERFGFLFE